MNPCGSRTGTGSRPSPRGSPSVPTGGPTPPARRRKPPNEDPLILWESATGRPLATYPEANFPLAFRPDGKVLVYTWNTIDRLRAVDLATGRPIWTSPPMGLTITGVAFRPGGTEMLVTRMESEGVRVCQIWDAIVGRPIVEPWKREGRLLADGRILLLERAEDGRDFVSLVDSAGGRSVVEWPSVGRRIQDANLAPDGRTLWQSSYDSQILRHDRASGRLWDLPTHRPIGPVLEKTVQAPVPCRPGTGRSRSPTGRSCCATRRPVRSSGPRCGATVRSPPTPSAPMAGP